MSTFKLKILSMYNNKLFIRMITIKVINWFIVRILIKTTTTFWAIEIITSPFLSYFTTYL